MQLATGAVLLDQTHAALALIFTLTPVAHFQALPVPLSAQPVYRLRCQHALPLCNISPVFIACSRSRVITCNEIPCPQGLCTPNARSPSPPGIGWYGSLVKIEVFHGVSANHKPQRAPGTGRREGKHCVGKSRFRSPIAVTLSLPASRFDGDIVIKCRDTEREETGTRLVDRWEIQPIQDAHANLRIRYMGVSDPRSLLKGVKVVVGTAPALRGLGQDPANTSAAKTDNAARTR